MVKGHDREVLVGLKEITDHMGMSEDTILNLIRSNGFPCRKTSGKGGTWISSKSMIDQWAAWFCKSGGMIEDETR